MSDDSRRNCDDLDCLNCLFGQEEDGTIICALDDSVTEEPCERWEEDK